MSIDCCALTVVLEYFGVMSNTVSRLDSAGYVHSNLLQCLVATQKAQHKTMHFQVGLNLMY